MAMIVVGAIVGAVVMAPAGLAPWGAACGGLLAVWVRLAEDSASNDADWREDVAAGRLYRVGRLVIAGALVAGGLVAAGLAAGIAGR